LTLAVISYIRYSRDRGTRPWTASERASDEGLIVFRPATLLERLRRAAAVEGTDVSALLCRIAERYLKRRKGGRR